jgi:hypothetical protein
MNVKYLCLIFQLSICVMMDGKINLIMCNVFLNHKSIKNVRLKGTLILTFSHFESKCCIKNHIIIKKIVCTCHLFPSKPLESNLIMNKINMTILFLVAQKL